MWTGSSTRAKRGSRTRPSWAWWARVPGAICPLPALIAAQPHPQPCALATAPFPSLSLFQYNNRFYTALANASATCDCCGTVSLAQLQAVNPTLEANFSSSPLPSADTIVAWARAKLQMPEGWATT